MNREPTSLENRNQAVRALLVSIPQDPSSGSSPEAASARHHSSDSRRTWMRPLAAAAIAVAFVLVLFVGLTRLHNGTSAPATTESTSTRQSDDSTTSLTAGKVIGEWSSTSHPVSYGGTVSTGGLALSGTLVCYGGGSIAISVSHVFDMSGSCDSNKSPEPIGNSGGITKPITVKIRTHGGHPTWKLVLRTAEPTTFTPKPVRAVDGNGHAVRYCTSADLAATFVHVPEPEGVTKATTGEVVITNTSADLCAVSGNPTGNFLTAAGAPVGHHANGHTDTRNYSTRRILEPVLIKHGEHAYIQTNYSTPDIVDNCKPTPAKALRFSTTNSGFSPAVTFTVAIPTVQACTNPKALQLFATQIVGYPADLRTPAQITAAATCHPSELAIAYRHTADQAGEQTGAISFHNTGTRTCHLNGTPALTFLNTDGKPIGRHTGVQLHGGNPDQLDADYDKLAPNQTLYLHFAIQPAAQIARCEAETTRTLQTTTGQHGYNHTVTLPAAVSACGNGSVTQLRAAGFISEKDYKLNSLPQK